MASVGETVAAHPKQKGKTAGNSTSGPMKSKAVTLRGLQFFAGDAEAFPPLVPYQP